MEGSSAGLLVCCICHSVLLSSPVKHLRGLGPSPDTPRSVQSRWAVGVGVVVVVLVLVDAATCKRTSTIGGPNEGKKSDVV